MNLIEYFVSALILVLSPLAHAQISVPMSDLQSAANLGTITLSDTPYGLLITPALSNLSPGLHGFHIHAMPSCENHGTGAGAHFDPANTKQHNGPYNKMGHLGDLPALTVDADGNAMLPVLAPRLTTKAIHGRALMIHAGSDNYSDIPNALGGGGARVACGVIP